MIDLNKAQKISHYQILLPLGSLIIGIFIQKFFNLNIYTLILALLCFLILIIKTKNSYFIKPLLSLIFLISGGIIFTSKILEFRNLQKTLTNKELKVECEVLENKPTKNKLYKEAIKFKALDLESKTNFNFLCFSSFSTDLKIGDQIYLEDLKIPSSGKKNKVKNFDKPDFEEYLIKEQIIGTCFLKKLNYKKIENESFYEKLILIKKNLLERFEKKFSNQAHALFSLMFLGNKSVLIEDSLKDKFSFWGLLHYLARSGLHVVVFILFWRFLLSFIPISFRYKQIFLILLSIIYALLSFPSVSFSRAFLVFVFYEIGKLFEMQVIFLYLLSLTCLFMVIANPLIVLFLDFQLSFGLTFALSLLSYNFKS